MDSSVVSPAIIGPDAEKSQFTSKIKKFSFFLFSSHVQYWKAMIEQVFFPLSFVRYLKLVEKKEVSSECVYIYTCVYYYRIVLQHAVVLYLTQ